MARMLAMPQPEAPLTLNNPRYSVKICGLSNGNWLWVTDFQIFQSYFVNAKVRVNLNDVLSLSLSLSLSLRYLPPSQLEILVTQDWADCKAMPICHGQTWQGQDHWSKSGY